MSNSDISSSAIRIRVPGEWEKHDSVWLAWPYEPSFWGDHLTGAKAEFQKLCLGIADIDANGQPQGERLNILVPNNESLNEAAASLLGCKANFITMPYGDIWLRDTAPIFAISENSSNYWRVAQSFRFNGWGQKFVMEGDEAVSAKIAELSHDQVTISELVLEGGSLEFDGEGTCITSRQCLLNANRNPNLSEAQIGQELKQSLGVQKLLWVDEGLLNDHTDGHIDNIVRFVGPGEVVCMQPTGTDDPNFATLQKIEQDLKAMSDARGRRLTVHTIPSPGRITNEFGQIVPASSMNFYISNTSVLVPTYGGPREDFALEKLGTLFPTRKIVGLPARAILSGGGSFHCITQQVPTLLQTANTRTQIESSKEVLQ